jgi:ABC-type uncharacterized transport system substrate-binding protein
VAIRAAQQATKSIPILGVTEDMIGEKFVNSLVRPNSNTTGISILATELDGKRQEILIEAVPGLRRMSVLADASSTSEAKLHSMQEAARAHNVELFQRCSRNSVDWDMSRGRVFWLSDIPAEDEPRTMQTWLAKS